MKGYLRSVLFLLLCLALLLPSFPVLAEEEPADTALKTELLPPANLSEEEKNALLSALFQADIATQREAIALRLITCRELTDYYLERIEAYNKPYNCFITLCDNATEVADRRDATLAAGEAKGSLFGIPIVVKDNIDYEGYHTTNGYKKKDEQIAKDNAAIVDNLIAEGAVILAKTNMSKGAQDARLSISSSVGETRNAYNIDLACGGSSGGSAVATALHFAAGSLGTDTNSSLRYPAALNGCVSLRPTTGLLDRDGIVILNTKRDTPGAITRTVKDQAILLDTLVGNGTYTQNLNANALEGLRIGILKELSGPVSSLSSRKAGNLDKEILATFDRAVEELRACGAEVIEVSMPKVFTLSNACANNTKKSVNAFYTAFEALLKDNDIAAVIFPTYLHAPQWRGVSESGTLKVYEQNFVTNVKILAPPLGIPEITVPIGTHSRGAGIGLEIASLRNNEQLLLDMAYSYTTQYDHRAIPEGAADLYAAYGGASLSEILADYRDFLTTPETSVDTEEPLPETTETTAGSEGTVPDTAPDMPSSTEPADTGKEMPSAVKDVLTLLIVIPVAIGLTMTPFLLRYLKEKRRNKQ
ncbi:MAG: amidase [Ruminococcaceae bacterium]|nr:amidase [Oscillospiraceae bacterium]